MRFAVYNSMFSLNGRSLWSNLIGHWSIHFQANPNEIWKRTNLDETINTIKQSNSDVIAICEILEGQEKELTRRLKKIGFNYILFGNGHKTKFSRLQIKLAVASKTKLVLKNTPKFPTLDKMGGGGGFVKAFLTKEKLTIFAVHLGHKEIYDKQIKFLEKNLSKTKGKIVLMGDFNKKFEDLKQNFPQFKLASNQINTCSLTPVFRLFHFQDDDHILVKNLKPISYGFLEGFSDHRLIYSEVE